MPLRGGVLHVAHFQLVHASDSWLKYRLEGSGHVVMFPRGWFAYPDPPQDISIEIYDRQLSLLENSKGENEHGR